MKGVNREQNKTKQKTNNVFFKWQEILNHGIFSSDRKISDNNNISCYHTEKQETSGGLEYQRELLIFEQAFYNVDVEQKGERLA